MASVEAAHGQRRLARMLRSCGMSAGAVADSMGLAAATAERRSRKAGHPQHGGPILLSRRNCPKPPESAVCGQIKAAAADPAAAASLAESPHSGPVVLSAVADAADAAFAAGNQDIDAEQEIESIYSQIAHNQSAGTYLAARCAMHRKWTVKNWAASRSDLPRLVQRALARGPDQSVRCDNLRRCPGLEALGVSGFG